MDCSSETATSDCVPGLVRSPGTVAAAVAGLPDLVAGDGVVWGISAEECGVRLRSVGRSGSTGSVSASGCGVGVGAVATGEVDGVGEASLLGRCSTGRSLALLSSGVGGVVAPGEAVGVGVTVGLGAAVRAPARCKTGRSSAGLVGVGVAVVVAFEGGLAGCHLPKAVQLSFSLVALPTVRYPTVSPVFCTS